MNNMEQPGPRKCSSLKSLRCCVCWELGVPPLACQPSPAPFPCAQALGNLLNTTEASQTSGLEGLGSALFPQDWGIQAWKTCFGVLGANLMSFSAGLWNY